MTRSPPRSPTDGAETQQVTQTGSKELHPAAGTATPATLDPRVARAAQGDRQAAQSLLLELLPRVRNLIRYLIRGDSDVDDVTQLVLLELLRSFGTYKGTGSLKGWADRITVRVTLRRQKQSAHHRDRMKEALAGMRVMEPSATTLDEYLNRRRVVRLLDDVPDEQRQALVLHHVVGLSVPEVAQELSVPGETVRSRLRLGMHKLRAGGQTEDDA